MDIYKYLVLVKGQDKTEQIRHIDYQGGLCKVTFRNGTYHYSRSDLTWINALGRMDCGDQVVYARGILLQNVSQIINFGRIKKVVYKNGYSEIYRSWEVSIQKNVISTGRPREAFSYLKAVAQEISLIIDGQYNILGQQYSNIKAIGEGTVLGSFLSERPSVRKFQLCDTILYPFGLNKSQKTAVENALTSQISIIQGPPGTGKTQTILNILANIVCAKKSVAVVSNNNAAIENVIQKLKNNDLDFLTACLGNKENKSLFLRSQSGSYPQMNSWILEEEEKKNVSNQIKALTDQLNKQMELKEKGAFLDQQLRELEAESHYFEEYYEDSYVEAREIKKADSKKLLSLWNEFEDLAQGNQRTGFWSKVGLCFKYGFSVFQLFKLDPREAISNIQKQYYEVKKEELFQEKKKLEEQSEQYNFSENLDLLTKFSMMYFKDQMAGKYRGSEKRTVFDRSIFHQKSAMLVKEYPVILSTTYSIKNCLEENFLYDYIIIDEASQVDLVTGVLAMSCAKNMVIVGDTKQLPNVVTAEEIKISKKYWKEGLDIRFHFEEQSLLSSAVLTWENAKSVLLREHYRCNLDIINFCNQKFYDNQLIIMSKNKEEDEKIPTLSLYKTPEGNHARNHMNQREIDVIKNEVLPKYVEKGELNIGIITPYKDQVSAMKKQLPDFCEIDTVHKFQGREKDIIILSSVLNEIDDFVNDPNMLNVAVSRAVKSLAVVTSGNKINENTYYGELAKYIEYNNYSVVESKTYSVFDLLYKEYYKERQKYLARHKRISEWDSENLMYGVIEEVLSRYRELDCSCHVPLAMVIKDVSGLEEREIEYVLNPLTHLDFLIFKKLDKSPVLGIEVDGVKFHQEGCKQAERDKRKNHIMETVAIPFIRLRTDGSNEKQILTQKLEEVTTSYEKNLKR